LLALVLLADADGWVEPDIECRECEAALDALLAVGLIDYDDTRIRVVDLSSYGDREDVLCAGTGVQLKRRMRWRHGALNCLPADAVALSPSLLRGSTPGLATGRARCRARRPGLNNNRLARMAAFRERNVSYREALNRRNRPRLCENSA